MPTIIFPFLCPFFLCVVHPPFQSYACTTSLLNNSALVPTTALVGLSQADFVANESIPLAVRSIGKIRSVCCCYFAACCCCGCCCCRCLLKFKLSSVLV